MNGTAPAPRPLGGPSREGLHHFRVCGTCGALYETGRPDGLDQRCRCDPRDAERWPGFDVNERACLCACCGTQVLQGGTRWSPYFCRECQTLAMGVSLRAQRLVIPIGRHSMMHTFVANPWTPGPAPRGGTRRDAAERLYDDITSISIGSDPLRQWSATIVRRHLRRLGVPGGTPLVEYLDAIVKEGESPARWDLFAEMCEFFRASGTGTVN